MIIDEALSLAGAVLLLIGSFLCLTAAIGLLRLPDVLTRMHAATKPQTLGLLCILTGLALSLRQPAVLGMLFLAGILQLMTAPVSAHMVARTAYRTHQYREDLLVTDELADDLSKAGFELVETESADEDPGEDSASEDKSDDATENDPDQSESEATLGSTAAGSGPTSDDPVAGDDARVNP